MQVYDVVMRTTIDLPDDLHGTALSMARDRGQSLSRTVVELMREGLRGRTSEPSIETDPVTSLPVFRTAGRITMADVAALDDEP